MWHVVGEWPTFHQLSHMAGIFSRVCPQTFFWGVSTYIWPCCVLKNFQNKSGNDVLWKISSHDSYIFVSEVRHAHSPHSQHHSHAASPSTQKPSVCFPEDGGSQHLRYMLEYSAIMAPFVSCANT